MKVFIIDDDPISIFLTESTIQLGEFPVEVQTYLSAEKALMHLQLAKREELPDIIFLDLNMPQVNGWEFLESFQQLKEDNLDKSLIYILTSSLDTSDLIKAEAYSIVQGFLHKPISREDMMLILNGD